MGGFGARDFEKRDYWTGDSGTEGVVNIGTGLQRGG